MFDAAVMIDVQSLELSDFFEQNLVKSTMETCFGSYPVIIFLLSLYFDLN